MEICYLSSLLHLIWGRDCLSTDVITKAGVAQAGTMSRKEALEYVTAEGVCSPDSKCVRRPFGELT